MMDWFKRFFAALWSIFKTNVKENRDAIREQVVGDVKNAAKAASGK